MRDNVKILGILNIVIGCLGMLVALCIFAFFGGLAGIAGAAATRETDGMLGAGVLAAIGAFVAILIALLSLPQIIGGWGLTKFKPWARILMIVISIINLFHVPIGTAIGVYGLWVLFSDETKRLFETGGQPPLPQAGPYVPAYPPEPPRNL
jgi:hypothetical protein